MIGRAKLAALGEQDREIARWIANWVAELRDAHWKRPADIAGHFPKARLQSDGTFLFPIADREFEIHVMIAFPRGIALILSIKLFDVANGN